MDPRDEIAFQAEVLRRACYHRLIASAEVRYWADQWLTSPDLPDDIFIALAELSTCDASVSIPEELTALASGLPTLGIMLTAAIFGLTTFPIFSIAAAHAHDFAASEERIALSAALMFWFAVGAIAAPWFASVLIELYGPPALFVMIAAGHAVLVVFGLIRMRKRRASESRTRYIYTPRSTFLVGRLLSGTRERSNQED